MQKYVVALEESKLLKELLPEGFKSYLYYEQYRVQSINKKWTEWSPWVLRRSFDCKSNNGYQEVRHYPAPITDELLELLPREVTITSDHHLMKNICPFKATLTMLSLDDGRYYFYSRHGNVCHGTTKTYNKAQMEHNKMMYGGSDEPINDATALSELYRWLKGEELI
jgi:hypothetical protein